MLMGRVWEVCVAQEHFFSISLQMKPGSKPRSAQDRESSGFVSLTDQGVQDRSGDFVTGKGNASVLMELPLSAVPVL